MRLIVADSGPLIILARSIGLKSLLLYAEEVRIPSVVYAECTADATKPGSVEVREAVANELIHVEQLTHFPGSLAGIKNEGEKAAIALAIKHSCPILVDDRRGRELAAANSLVVVGTTSASSLATKSSGVGAE